jgi:hypothetical protein
LLLPANQPCVIPCGNPSTIQPIIVTFKKQRGWSNFIQLYVLWKIPFSVVTWSQIKLNKSPFMPLLNLTQSSCVLKTIMMCNWDVYFVCLWYISGCCQQIWCQWYFENCEDDVHGLVINLRNHYTYLGLHIHIFLTYNLAGIHMGHLFS